MKLALTLGQYGEFMDTDFINKWIFLWLSGEQSRSYILK